MLLRAEVIEICKRLDAAGHLKAEAKKARTAAIATPEPALATLRQLAEKGDVSLDGASLGDLRIHDLRRTLGSWQAKTGASLSIIGKSPCLGVTPSILKAANVKSSAVIIPLAKALNPSLTTTKYNHNITMNYRILISTQASKKLKSLAKPDRLRITDKITQLGHNPDSPELDVKKMEGQAGWRLRVGGWRVIFERHDQVKIIAVEKIGSRGDIYK